MTQAEVVVFPELGLEVVQIDGMLIALDGKVPRANQLPNRQVAKELRKPLEMEAEARLR